MVLFPGIPLGASWVQSLPNLQCPVNSVEDKKMVEVIQRRLGDRPSGASKNENQVKY